MSSKWKFHVRGTFVRCGTGEPIGACEAIVESGDRAEHSPFRLEGVGPGARANTDGSFHTWFVTKGADSEVEVPAEVSVFVRIAPGKWRPYVVTAQLKLASRLSATEMQLHLGPVLIDQDECCMWPNPALNRTGRYAASTWRASARPAG
jgi:hypothetical protein